MLIDSHVHVFPDKLAQRALDVLLNNVRSCKYAPQQQLHYDGTCAGLKRQMELDGVDISVIAPIATSVRQFHSINTFAEEISDGKIISLASLHPYQEDIDGALDYIKEHGFKGIKLHPDYQEVYVDDEKFISLVKKAGERGLHTLIHAGHDAGIKPPNRGAAKHMRVLLNKVDSSKVTLAHMGGFDEWDDVERYFVGTDVYFDTAVVSRFMDIEQYRRIIDRHGADKILFGSDSPWESPADTLAFLKAAHLSDEEFELITHKNAEKLLGL